MASSVCRRRPRARTASGFSLQTGLGIAKFAGGMYLRDDGRSADVRAFEQLRRVANLGGMGMLGNPMLYQMQGAGLGSSARALA